MKFISCFGPGGWDLYAKKFVETFDQHFPKEVSLTVYYHDCPAPEGTWERVRFVNLLEAHDEIAAWKAKHSIEIFQGKQGDQYNFRYDALKFCHKVFALSHAASELVTAQYNGWLVWLDADTFATKEVTLPWLKEQLPDGADIVHLPRKTMPYSETSFVGFNFARPKAPIFISDLMNIYVDDELFNYKEWHDGWIFSRLLYIHNYNGLAVHSLTPPGYDGIDAFENSPLGERLTHLKGNRKVGPKKGGLMPLRIRPVDSMPKEHIQKSAKAAEKLIQRWLKKCEAHDREVLIVSAGESIRKKLPEIKRRQKAGAYVLAVKHSLPILVRAGIEPDGVVILDPRDITKESTHGIVRSTLFDVIPKKTTFFVATMTDTSVVKFLMKRTKKVVGWVAWTQALKDVPPKAGQAVLQGGTCAAWRALHLIYQLGFRKARLYGYDFVVDPKKVDLEALDDKGRKKYMKVFIGKDKKPTWTTGELCAGIQDVTEMLNRVLQSGVKVTMVGNVGAAAAWNEMIASVPKKSARKEKLVKFEKEYR